MRCTKYRKQYEVNEMRRKNLREKERKDKAFGARFEQEADLEVLEKEIGDKER